MSLNAVPVETYTFTFLYTLCACIGAHACAVCELACAKDLLMSPCARKNFSSLSWNLGHVNSEWPNHAVACRVRYSHAYVIGSSKVYAISTQVSQVQPTLEEKGRPRLATHECHTEVACSVAVCHVITGLQPHCIWSPLGTSLSR